MWIATRKPSEAKTKEPTSLSSYHLTLKTPALLLLLTVLFHQGASQDTLKSDPSQDKKRLRTVLIGTSAGYTLSMAGLYELWYKDAGNQSFRFFNDNAEWKQVDKFGHFGSSFYLSYGAHKALRWSGVKNNKAEWIAPLAGFLILLPIEVFDGHSQAYGASVGDLTANAAGSLFFYGQQAIWDDIRIYPKFSFHPTSYADRRPDVLGDHVISQIFKDYNGQTYWFSFDMDKFAPVPEWLNIAVGYGAEDMVYARDRQNIEAGYHPYRQYYFSLDPDLTAIKTRSKLLKTLIFLANIIKIPTPTLSYSRKGVKFHPLHF